MPVSLERREGGVYVLTMDDADNRMNRVWLDALADALDEVLADPDAAALVTVGSGKFYSNGLDLDWLMSDDGEPMVDFVAAVERVWARVLGFPLVTVAACNGHTFAGGALFALCHDFRVMRADRGFFCLPEVDIKIPFTPGMSALVKARLAPQAAHEAMVTGRRYGGIDAAAKGMVDAAVAEDEVLPMSVEMAGSAGGKDPEILGVIKSRIYGPVIELFENSPGTTPM